MTIWAICSKKSLWNIWTGIATYGQSVWDHSLWAFQIYSGLRVDGTDPKRWFV